MRQIMPIFLLVASMLFFSSCKEENQETNNTITNKGEITTTDLPDSLKKVGPQITFTSNIFKFGEVVDGEKVIHDFDFTNTGDQPLIIFNAKPTCGCTISDYPKTPIQPGESGSIKAEFNSKGRVGKAHKVLKVKTNATSDILELTLEGVVLKNPNAEK